MLKNVWFVSIFLSSTAAYGQTEALSKLALGKYLQNESYFSAEDQRSVLKQKKKCKEKIQKITDDVDQDFQLTTCLKESVIRIVIKYTYSTRDHCQ